MGLISMASVARMTVISEQVDATVDRFIGILSFCRLWAAFSFRPQLGLAVGAQHASLNYLLYYCSLVNYHENGILIIRVAHFNL